MTHLALAALMMLSGGHAPGTARTTTVDSAAVVQQAARADNATQRICVRSQDATATILSRTVCRTRAEWDRTGGLPNQNNR